MQSQDQLNMGEQLRGRRGGVGHEGGFGKGVHGFSKVQQGRAGLQSPHQVDTGAPGVGSARVPHMHALRREAGRRSNSEDEREEEGERGRAGRVEAQHGPSHQHPRCDGLHRLSNYGGIERPP